jgi:hypothetical protein
VRWSVVFTNVIDPRSEIKDVSGHVVVVGNTTRIIGRMCACGSCFELDHPNGGGACHDGKCGHLQGKNAVCVA